MKLPHDRDRRALDDELAEFVRVPLPPQESIEVPVAEPFDGRRHLALEGKSPHLTIRDDVEPGLLLKAQRVLDRAVLDLLELGRVELSLRELLLRVEELGRAQQAPDDVCAGLQHRVTLVPKGYDSGVARRRGCPV